METSLAPKKLPAFITESFKRSCILAWVYLLNRFSKSKYTLVMENGQFAKKKTDTQRMHPIPFSGNQRFVVVNTKM